jgi:O-glycosyl hydrolase
MKFDIFLILLLSCGSVYTVFAQNSVNAKSDTSIVIINEHKTRQTITSIGGNYCQATYTRNAWDEVAEHTLLDLHPSHVRFPIPLRAWEPENDNLNPRSLQFSRFEQQEVIGTLFRMLKDMKEKYGVTNFTAAVWDAPDWMVENPEKQSQRKIMPSVYLELIESVAAFLVMAKEDHGIEIDYFSFNEATGGYQILFTPEEIIRFMALAGPYFESFGLKTKFLVADSHKTGGTVEYARPILETDSISRFLGPLAYHSWWSGNLPDSEFVRIAELADAYDKEVWCTELGYDAMLYKDKSNFPTWKNAWELARINFRVLKHSRANLTQYWTYQNNFPVMAPDGEPYPAYFVIKHSADYLPDGAVVVDAESNDSTVWSLAALLPGEERMLQLINTSEQTKLVRLENLPQDKYYRIQTDSGTSMEIAEEFQKSRNAVTISLPPQSINTITTVIRHRL